MAAQIGCRRAVSYTHLDVYKRQPTGQAAASRLGMMDFVEVEEAKALFREINLLLVFRQSNMDGGFFALVLTIYFTIFVCADFKNGFIKNIMSVHVNRWKYVGSKLLSFAILDIIYPVSYTHLDVYKRQS